MLDARAARQTSTCIYRWDSFQSPLCLDQHEKLFFLQHTSGIKLGKRSTKTENLR